MSSTDVVAIEYGLPQASEANDMARLLGVAEEFGGRGIAQQLVAKCLDHGTKRGYRRAVTEATNKVSQHVFRKLGFLEQVRRSYQDHRFDDRACFDSIASEGGPILMDRLLTSV